LRRSQLLRVLIPVVSLLLLLIVTLPTSGCGSSNSGGQNASSSPTPNTSVRVVYPDSKTSGVNCSDFSIAAQLPHPENEQKCVPGPQGELELREGQPPHGKESFFPEYDLTAAQAFGLKNYQFSVHVSLAESRENGAGVIVETPPAQQIGGYMFVVYPSGSWKVFAASSFASADNIETASPLAFGSVAPGRSYDLAVSRKELKHLTVSINGVVVGTVSAPWQAGMFSVMCVTPMLGIENARRGPVYFTNLQVTQ
jgi:hypothetical protein